MTVRRSTRPVTHEQPETLLSSIIDHARNRERLTASFTGVFGLDITVERPVSPPGEPADLVGDDSRLISAIVVRALANLLLTAIELDCSTLSVRMIPIRGGTFREDDASGIPGPRWDAVFDAGVPTKVGGAGFELVSSRRVMTACGWDVPNRDGTAGGARFPPRRTRRGPAAAPEDPSTQQVNFIEYSRYF